jgi:hypothetical protein
MESTESARNIFQWQGLVKMVIEPSTTSIKGQKFLDHVNGFQLFSKHSDLWSLLVSIAAIITSPYLYNNFLHAQRKLKLVASVA